MRYIGFNHQTVANGDMRGMVEGCHCAKNEFFETAALGGVCWYMPVYWNILHLISITTHFQFGVPDFLL